MAVAHAAAAAAGLPLWRYLAREPIDVRLPLPEIQIFGGGAHAGSRVDMQDFMVIAIGAEQPSPRRWTGPPRSIAPPAS